ncbi:concanavalin A-like lectin/glucanase domain-containing protein [Rhizophagus diaphanus]|nr:concanavalin A-like lectin/glucanase domain-containing protein [Rhizophagus diaphanus] [Rhizophagus sp. MUCL 43196]
MSRGYSLEQDLKLLINNPKYSDIEILCEDEKKLYGCRAILAARSEVFDRLLYNGMKESYENQISLPKINSAAMEIILEYTYTGSIKEESLTKDNTIEAFYAADYFQLPDLQHFIMKTFKNTLEKNYYENYSPELLSKFAGKMPLTEDNILLNLLVEAVANIPLNTIEFGRLSIAGLRYLLYCTHEKEAPFSTTEYEVFRYSAILAAKQVSNGAYKTLIERLPTLEQIEQLGNSIQVQNNFITDHQKVAKELEPLVQLTDFRRINGRILVNIIEPLGIAPNEIILDVYRYNTLSNNSILNSTRGIPKMIYVWDESSCGSKLIIEDNGKVVHAPSNLNSLQSVRAKMVLENKGIFEWDVIIEKDCSSAWVGVCSSENFNYETFAGYQLTGWVFGSSSGYCYNSGDCINNYCPSFGDGTKVTVHLDMNKRTCSFTVNGTKYPKVSSWNNLPSKLYPVVSLRYPGRIRIQAHQSNI